jgi:lipopolysaccharide/colanic/teichoic acid biosynthesis glycosyltransferase
MFLMVAVAVKLTSPGPIFYRARRVGKSGTSFAMLKFRTMNVQNGGAVITSKGDTRIFPVGAILRRLKIDELPQFVNVLMGDMAVVGPRPEDPKIVENHYSSWMIETLSVSPGITSFGAVFYYGYVEDLVDVFEPEMSYVNLILQPKLAIERAYIERATFISDVHCIILTAVAIVGAAAGYPVSPPRQDLQSALKWVPKSAFPNQLFL